MTRKNAVSAGSPGMTRMTQVMILTKTNPAMAMMTK